MTAHIIAAELVRKMPELVKDSPLNQMLTIEAMLLEFQHRIVEQAVAAMLLEFQHEIVEQSVTTAFALANKYKVRGNS